MGDDIFRRLVALALFDERTAHAVSADVRTERLFLGCWEIFESMAWEMNSGAGPVARTASEEYSREAALEAFRSLRRPARSWRWCRRWRSSLRGLLSGGAGQAGAYGGGRGGYGGAGGEIMVVERWWQQQLAGGLVGGEPALHSLFLALAATAVGS